MYIHVSWSWRHLGILRHLFQVGIAILGFYIGNNIEIVDYYFIIFLFLTAYSRVSDYQHHWNDILTGMIFGSFIAFFTFKFILIWRYYTPAFLPYTISSSASTVSEMYRRRNPNIYAVQPQFVKDPLRYYF